MKQGLIILTFLLAKTCFGQSSIQADTSLKIFDSVSSLMRVCSLKISEVSGVYFCSNGLAGYRLILDSNQTFKKIGFDCMSNSIADFGSWDLQTGNTLIIKSNNIATIFNIIKLDNFYFLVSGQQKEKFVNDFYETKKVFKNAKPLIVDGKNFLVERMIGLTLIEKYFAKELDDSAGS